MGKCDEANVEMSMGDSASPMKPDIFTFTVPPEAPVFEPTPEEFLDPLAYINKIKPIAEKSGICKIKPPPAWQPPFAVDVDKLRFTPRIQRLNELEAITRVKLNFLDQMVKFWELQGSVLKIPIVERKPLDLYSLHKIVQEAGGFDSCTSERKWSKVAVRLGHPQGKGMGSIIKSHYERILYPYDVFKTGGQRTPDTKLDVKREGETTPEKRTRSSTAANTPPPAARRYPPPRTPVKHEDTPEGSRVDTAIPETKEIKEEEVKIKAANKRYTMSMGSCGSRARLTRSSKLREHRQNNMSVSVTPAPNDPLAKYMCHVCGRGDVEEQMLLCDGCDDSYHTFCLVPPLADVPKGDWRCPVCVAEEVSKPTEAFGFEQAQREYTLQQFGEMADQFKSDYFNLPVHMVPTSTVEREFWRVVSSIDEDVTVEYGADLHSMDHGSGFPTKGSTNLYPGEQEYAESGWNLNNLPVMEGSVLGHINADISGMKIPWMYVGMCFSTFCWHNEDHWSYSINYLHWGEPKTWYGVPGNKAEQLEQTMKCNAPELFHWQPDLLHQLVTIMNPNILMKAGVPVFRTDQNAGEFVITFPRAYHAGFNQGYNFAEAVNFTPADWLKAGRECIAHYSTLRRQCVFSHDELVCKMSLEADNLGLGVAVAAYRDMRTMLTEERKLRKQILEWGVTDAEREAFELLPDDARQCVTCNTTCFLSAVSCKCSSKLACLKHYDQLCSSAKKCGPTQHVLKFRYTLDELPVMLDKLKRKADEYREWADAVQNALDPHTPKTCDLEGLKALLKRAHDLKIQKTELVRALETAVEDAEKCATVIQQLDLNKMRTRTRHRDTQHDPKYRLTLEELTLFCEEIDGLACVLPEGSAVKELLRQTSEFERRAQLQLNEDLKSEEVGGPILREVEDCCELGARLCIRLPMLPALQARLSQLRWLDDVAKSRRDWESLTPDAMQKLIDNGQNVPPHRLIEETMAQLHELGKKAAEWESKAKVVLVESNGPLLQQHSTLTELEQLLTDAEDLECALPSLHTLTLAVSHARDWLGRVEEMQAKDSYPYYHSLEVLVKKGQSIPLSLYEKDHLASALVSAREWKEGTAQIFLKKSWPYSLMEALSPRTDILTPAPQNSVKSRKAQPNAPGQDPPPSSLEAGLFLRNFTEDSSPTEIVAAFKHAEEREMANMKELRSRNMRKEVRAPAQPNLSFCVCGKRQYGLMMQCELCKDWYHSQCAAAMNEDRDQSPGRGTPSPTQVPLSPLQPAVKKFLCGECVRTRRPRLERILGLLVWLQRLPVRLAEGEALQCVTERAMAWQDAARAQLALPQLAHALATAAQHPANGESNGKGKSNAASEHAYSAAPRSGYATNSVRLPNALLHKLEELMMEGDLLEVTLDEQEHLWAVVSAARPLHHSHYTVSSTSAHHAARVKRRLTKTKPHKPIKRSKQIASNGGTGAQPTTTNYLNRRGRGGSVNHGQPLLMRKHYMARQERKRRQMQNRTQRNTGAGRRPKSSSRGGGRSNNVVSKEDQGDQDTSSSSGDEDEDCAAKPCLRPTGKEVDWVQCDGGCEGWFHMHCVGVRKTALREDDEYHCASCKRKSSLDHSS